MTELRLYLDEDASSNRLYQALLSRGIDVVATIDAEMLAQSDEAQLEWAFAHQRVIYSFNVRDFYRIHSNWLAVGKSHAGIILGKQEYSIGTQLKGLLKLLSRQSATNMKNRIEFL